MPNGDDQNWTRICAAVDGFRGRYGCWPTSVRLPPRTFANVVGHVLSPAGFALVSSVLEIISDDDLAERVAIIAVGDEGTEFRYGEDKDGRKPEPSAISFFGDAVLREGLDYGLDYVTIEDAKGNVVWAGKGIQATAPSEATKKVRKRPLKHKKKASGEK